MTLSGDLIIGGANVRGAAAAFSAINPANGSPMEPSFAGATKEQVEEATSLAWDAFPVYKETSLDDRARFLEAIAEGIVALGDDLVLRAIDETGLPRGRIEESAPGPSDSFACSPRRFATAGFRNFASIRLIRSASQLQSRTFGCETLLSALSWCSGHRIFPRFLCRWR